MFAKLSASSKPGRHKISHDSIDVMSAKSVHATKLGIILPLPTTKCRSKQCNFYLISKFYVIVIRTETHQTFLHMEIVFCVHLWNRKEFYYREFKLGPRMLSVLVCASHFWFGNGPAFVNNVPCFITNTVFYVPFSEKSSV